MKKRVRSAQEQAIATSRVAAAVRLQQHRPKVQADRKQYDRKRAKRLWQKDQEALSSLLTIMPLFGRGRFCPKKRWG